MLSNEILRFLSEIEIDITTGARVVISGTIVLQPYGGFIKKVFIYINIYHQ